MVKFNFIFSSRDILCLLIAFMAANVSAQNYPTKKQLTNPRTSTQSRSTQNSTTRNQNTNSISVDVGNFLDNLFKKNLDKKEKSKENTFKDKSSISSSKKENTSSNTVTLMVTGEGDTKDEAIKIALRNALEQTFGAFVSSNTTIINEELVKDEIVSISSGYIRNYHCLAENSINGKWYVSVQAVVSVDRVIEFVKSQKGSNVKVDFSSFVMNAKLEELNKRNKEIVISDIYHQIQKIPYTTRFDYGEIIISEPEELSGYEAAHYHTKGMKYKISVLVNVRANKNFDAVLGVCTFAVQLQNKHLLIIKEKQVNERNYQEKRFYPDKYNYVGCGKCICC